MKSVKFLVIAAYMLASLPAWANGPWNRFFQDGKFPTQAIMEHFKIAGPALASTTLLTTTAATTSGVALTVTTFSAQPDFPRNIVITPGGSTGSVPTGTIVITGTNIYNKVITENLTTSAGSASANTGAKAFKTVTSVVYPAPSNGSPTVSIGTGSKLGIPRCMANAGDYVFDEFAGVYATTRGTMAVDATHVESNTFTPNGTMDGSSAVDLFYVQNYRCYPN